MDYFSAERNNLYCKVKIIVSSFFGFLFCASSFRFPVQKQNQGPVVPFSISGLKTLISSEEDQKEKANRVIRSTVPVGIVRSKLLTHSSSSSSIRSCNFFMDDLIGTESGFCLTSNTEEIDEKSTPSDHRHNRTNRLDFAEQNHRCAAEKKFPPPIPFLANSCQNSCQNPGHRTRPPWILTRICSDGRLILKLERVRHFQSLESHRENGRLILNIVPAPLVVVGGSDDDGRDLQFIEQDEEEEDHEMESIDCEEGTDSEIAFKSFTYGGGGMFWDREPFCGVNRNFEGRHVVVGHFGSAPLRPMGTVI